jgi:transposase
MLRASARKLAEESLRFPASPDRRLKGGTMELLYTHCAGIDVHQKSVSVCVLTPGPTPASDPEVAIRQFGTNTQELLALVDWLLQLGVTHVAMESTGVYWKPVWNILEAHFTIILANAQHIRNVPGRKTDTADCQWIAQLLRHGLLKASFVPPREIRQLRDLCRTRTTLTREKTAVVNRLQKVLEDANVKLAGVVTDILGVSGRAMLKRMVAGQTDPAGLAQLARGPMRKKMAELQAALTGNITEHHRFLLKHHIGHIEYLDTAIAALAVEIERHMASYQETVSRWRTIPGIQEVACSNLVAEIGVNMDQFPSARHLVSWAGLCPGNHQSAGKRISSRTRKANPWLKALMTQVAWAASHTKDTYLSQQYRRLVKKCGKRRALLAVANTILTIIWHLAKHGTKYRELGPDYFDRLKGNQAQRYHVRKLENMGFNVTLDRTTPAA